MSAHDFDLRPNSHYRYSRGLLFPGPDWPVPRATLDRIANNLKKEPSMPSNEAAAPGERPKIEFTAIKGERSRTYHFPDGQKIQFVGVTALAVRPTGHRLVLASGKKFIVPGKFLVIEIDADEWCV